MTKTEIENKIYDLKRAIESCKNVIKANENEIKKLEAEKERPAFERVEKGLRYYCVGVNELGVTVEPHIDNRLIFSDAMFKNNNYFLTKERAEEVADKINFLLKLERLHDIYCLNYAPNWNDGKYKWYVFFDNELESYNFTSDLYWNKKVATYFDSEETAKKVCEILNKELEK
uniref:Uncharacterized protein n=1 Tax=Siphoviridae sp. ctqzz19 TaxID=2825682 RepID=A0A8S5U2D4_9CAUD|nr:MAG TPA: hypothetical protein [Siphoviridae sp. ctqzz19]